MNVTLPDGTTIEGVPEGTTQAQIADRLRASGRNVPAEWTAPKPSKPKKAEEGVVTNMPDVGLMEGAGNTLSGMVAKPVSDVAGLAQIPMHAMGLSENEPADVQRRVRDALTYEPRTREGKLVENYNPLTVGGQLWGSAAHRVRNAIAPPKTSGPVRDAVGNAVEEGINQAPSLAGAKVPAAADAAATAMKGGARELMQSALKPSKAELQTGKAASAVDTLLERGINVTPGGVRKLHERIDDLNGRIKETIENSPATIDKQKVGYYAQQAVDKFKDQVNATSDLATIQKSWDEFLNSFPDQIPIEQAQRVKQGTYRALGEKSYGELKGADIEAQKALARGLKEEIARAAPQVRQLNAEESKLLNALSITERRVLVSANKNPMGLGWLTTSPGKWAGFMADRSELFKSLAARMLNATADAVPTGAAAVAPAAGVAITDAADRNKPISQLPPAVRQRPIRELGNE